MPRSLTNLIRAIDELVEVNAQVRERLLRQQELLTTARAALLSGTSATDVLRATPPADEREDTDALIRTFYAKRSAVRDSVMRAAMVEGMSIHEIARAVGLHHDEVASRALQSDAAPPSTRE
jgi:hypothetical protein